MFSCLSVGLSVGQFYTFMKKGPLEYQMVTKTYIPSNLCGIDSSDRSDSSDGSDSSDQKTIFTKKKI